MGYRIYIGTYTEEIHFASGKVVYGKGEGIYKLWLDSEQERLVCVSVACGCRNPSYLALSRDGNYLYAANECKESGGIYGGSVSAFKVNRECGSLKLLNRRHTRGTDPCYVTLHPSCVYVCNYGSGSVAAYPILENGALGKMRQFIQYEGCGRHEKRQTGPHAHSMILFGHDAYGLVCDLGRDRIEAYGLDRNGHMNYVKSLCIECRRGAGPRHQVFSSDGSRLYTVNELDSTVSVYHYERQLNRFTAIQTVTTLVHDIQDINTCADIHLSPESSFLYVSNRGDSTIVIYSVNKDDGKLRMEGYSNSGGEVPRSFALTPDGAYLIVANQNSDNVVLFRIKEDGSLIWKDQVHVDNPVCVKIWD